MPKIATTDEGVRIAYDREGSGRPVILIGGAGQFRAVDAPTRALTSALAARGCDVVHYDRPGRGDSSGDGPFTLAGEVSALRTLVGELGGRAAVYGSSSGGAIALAAAAALPGVDRLVLWEVPLGPEGGSDGAEVPRRGARAGRHRGPGGHAAAVHGGDAAGVVRRHAPRPRLAAVRADGPHRRGRRRGAGLDAVGAARAAVGAAITVPTVVLLGTSAFPFFADAADAIVGALPDAVRGEVAGVYHGWRPDDLADAIVTSLRPPAGH